MKYCPSCGTEYRPGSERCFDCDEELIDRPPEPWQEKDVWEMVEREVVFSTGRRIDAEMVRGLLEARGLDARIWGGGMGAYRLESALTEVTGVPSPFNSYGVGVPVVDADEARAILAEVEDGAPPDKGGRREAVERSKGFLATLRQRWPVVAFALLLLWWILYELVQQIRLLA